MFIFFVLSQFKSFSKSQLKQEPSSLVPKDQKYGGNPHLAADSNYITCKQPSFAAYKSLQPHKSIHVIISNSSSSRLAISKPNCSLCSFVPCSCFVLRKHLSLPSCISWPLAGKLLGNHSSNCQKDTTAEFLTHPYPLYLSLVPSAILFALLPQLCHLELIPAPFSLLCLQHN